MILVVMLTGRSKFWKPVEEFLVPVNTELPSQHHSATQFINRQLPLENRTRGDVGII